MSSIFNRYFEEKFELDKRLKAQIHAFQLCDRQLVIQTEDFGLVATRVIKLAKWVFPLGHLD